MADDRFVGAWELVNVEIRDGQGNVIPDRKSPLEIGQIQYTADGRMSAHLMWRDRPKATPESWPSASDDERLKAAASYVAYFGTYTIDNTTNVVTHHVIGGLLPHMTGSDQPRAFQFSGENLTLSPSNTPGPEYTFLKWQRVRGS